jgi:hypothetical protein
VEGAQAVQGRLAKCPGGGDVEVDVAGGREEVAKGQRPVQVQSDQLVAEGLGDPSRSRSTARSTSGQGVGQAARPAPVTAGWNRGIGGPGPW